MLLVLIQPIAIPLLLEEVCVIPLVPMEVLMLIHNVKLK